MTYSSLGSREVYSGLSPGLLHIVWWTSQLTLIKETPFLLPQSCSPLRFIIRSGFPCRRITVLRVGSVPLGILLYSSWLNLSPGQSVRVTSPTGILFVLILALCWPSNWRIISRSGCGGVAVTANFNEINNRGLP